MRLGTQKRVGRALKNVSRSTLYRIRTDASLNFPQPIVVRGRLMFNMDEVEAWLATRPRVVTLPSRKQKREAAATAERGRTVLTEGWIDSRAAA